MNNKLYYLKLGDIIFIYNTIDEFIETGPPCKECLVQASCIKEIINSGYPPVMLQIYLCEGLNMFIRSSKLFHIHHNRLKDFDRFDKEAKE